VRDGKTVIAATTGSNPTAGLVFYDLKSALRNVKPKPKPAAAKKAAAKRPVRASGPGEGARGNREVSPTEDAEPKKSARKKTTSAATKKTTAARKPATRKKPDAS
jgi:hypothetical protein